MNKRKLLVFALFSVLTVPGFADNHVVENDGYDYMDYMAEVIARPWGIVTTIVGAGLYVGISPLTALFMIPKPHDSFVRLADIMVCNPFKWTFMRPIGDFAYTEENCARQVQPVAYQPSSPVVEPPKPVVTEPQVQYPQNNKQIDAIFKKEMMK